MAVPYTPEFYREWQASSLASARAILPFVLHLAPAQSAIDVGCGVGTWVKALLEAGVQDVLGVDGAHVPPDALLVERDRFAVRDLARSVDVGRRFDLALSLEVAEHLPPARADAFVEELVGLAPVVLFSAAIPFQEGAGHVNEQWPAWWAERFARHGYVAVDCVRDRFWNDRRVEYWYAQNTVLYVGPRALEGARAELARRVEAARGAAPLALVHPQRYLELADPRRMSLARAVRALPRVAASALGRRVHRAVRGPATPPAAPG